MTGITETEFESMPKEQQLDWMHAHMSEYIAALEWVSDVIDDCKRESER